MSEDKGFLQRWSKRKLAEKAPPKPPAPEERAAEGAVADDVQLPAEAPEPFDLSTLPALEDLTGESDLSAFLQKGVPEALKNAAMRRIWALDPLIRDATGPVDYAWDFNDPNSMPGFGPLSQDTDVAALLRQVMGEKEPQPEGATDALEAAADGPVSVSPPASDESDAEIADPDTHLAEGAPSKGDPEPGQPGIQLSEQAGRLLLESEKLSDPDTGTEDLSRIRKRHGGALPA